MTKRSTLNITKNMADKIPYIRCYEEHGIIETENGNSAFVDENWNAYSD